MNSAINYYSAAQRHTDAIREARRNPPLFERPVRLLDGPAGRRSLVAVFTRRLTRPHLLRPVIDRL